VVGAYYEDSSAVGIDGDETDNSASEAGAAYVFTGLDLRRARGEMVITATDPRQTLTADPALPTRFVYTARAQAGGRIIGFESGTDQVDLTDVLAEQGWTGTDPSADGTLRLLDRRGRCYLLIDPDGSTGSQRAFTQTVIDAVPCTDAGPGDGTRKRLPIGIQTFRKIREDDCYYVDKTGFRAAPDRGRQALLPVAPAPLRQVAVAGYPRRAVRGQRAAVSGAVGP
jgi:hypothetical protein